MSSPPTPTTSIRAAQLGTSNRKHQRRPSFPSIAVLNPFRKKAPKERTRSLSPVEPYEVAPGIWNTDATAKVFGYLEPTEKKGKSRSKSVGSGARTHSQISKRKPVAGKSSHDSTKKAGDGTGTDTSNRRPNRNYTELPSKSSPDPRKAANKGVTETEKSAGKEKMRTVSKDDQLVQRGANPRTGLVSPFIVSDSSDDNLVGHDYVKVGKIQRDKTPLPEGRTRSGKWKQQGAGWSLVESPLLSPIAQSINDPLSRKVSVKKLEDKLIVEMPGVDNPEPENMTDEQIRRYQEGVARAYKHGGSTAMVDPSALPSPRQSTSEGPSTPPNKLQRIRRKMVGSGPARKEESSDAVVMNAQEWASSALPPRKDRVKPPQVKDVVPTHVPKGPLLGTRPEDRSATAGHPFLGQRNKSQLGQMEGVAHSQSFQLMPQQEAQAGLQKNPTHPTQFPPLQLMPQQEPQTEPPNQPISPYRVHQEAHKRLPTEPEGQPMVKQEAQTGPSSKSKNRSTMDPVEPPASPTLSQWLPRLHFLHPSHFANLGTSSYRRPEQLLPERLRPAENRRQTIEDACITTITSTLNRKPENNQRSQVWRQDGILAVPGMRERPPRKYETSKENYLQAGTPRKKPSSDTKHMVDASGSSTIGQNVMQLAGGPAPARKTVEARHQSGVSPRQLQHGNRAFSQGAERAARVTVVEDYRSQTLRQGEAKKRPTAKTQGLCLGSANDIQDLTREDRRGGAGIIHTYDPLGDDCADDDCKARSTVTSHRFKDSGGPTDMGSTRDGGVWFAGEWVETLQDQARSDGTAPKSKEALAPRQSMFENTTSASLRFWALEELRQLSAKFRYVERRLYSMACHIIWTLHPASPALVVLQSPNARAQDYLSAAKEVFLACVYILLLLNIMLAVRKLLVLAGLLMFWVWHPMRMILGIIRWCVLA